VGGPAAGDDLGGQLAGALDRGDVVSALRLLRPAQLLLPIGDAAAAGAEPAAWATTRLDDRTWVVAFTSVEGLARASGGRVTRGRISSLPELAAAWPDHAWGLVVDPALPSQLSLEPGTVARLAAPSLADQVAADPQTPFPLLQAVVPHAQVDRLVDRGEGRVSGYVHQLMDVQHIATPLVLLASLGRSAEAGHLLDRAGSVFLLRWPAVGPELYRPTYGGRDVAGRDAVGGWIVEEEPFVGLGLAPSPDHLVREHRVHGVELPDGAQLWELDHSGEERRRAVWNGDLSRWMVAVRAPSGEPAR